jgi:hypothetical protein
MSAEVMNSYERTEDGRLSGKREGTGIMAGKEAAERDV